MIDINESPARNAATMGLGAYFRALHHQTTSGNLSVDSPAPAYRAELTPAGEQLVIPGCERQPTAKRAQLGLWD